MSYVPGPRSKVVGALFEQNIPVRYYERALY